MRYRRSRSRSRYSRRRRVTSRRRGGVRRIGYRM